MKLSEAIREGAKLKPQSPWKEKHVGSSCALGAAADVVGCTIADGGDDRLLEYFPQLMDQIGPIDEIPAGSLRNAVCRLNNGGRTREKNCGHFRGNRLLNLNRLVFKKGKAICTLPSKRYRLTGVTIKKGESIAGFQLNIVSFIGEVQSDVPVIFAELPGIEYLDADRKTAKISVKLDFRDKTDIEIILTPPVNMTDFEFIVDYEVL